MESLKNLSIEDFDYSLPNEKIAQFPLSERDLSKLLVFKNQEIIDANFFELSEYLSPRDILYFNNTKVVQARLILQKISGGKIELFCLEPAGSKEISSALQQKGNVVWNCLVGGAKKWKNGKISIEEKNIKLEAEKLLQQNDTFQIAFNWFPEHLTFAEILETFGHIPLPPYMNREDEIADKNRYQTIYAKWEGSVAAPTAGLHFTDRVFNKLEEKNIKKDFVTLHVGAGTFKPVKSETIGEHEMHAEFIDVSKSSIQNIIANRGNIIAVGTTSLRTLESLYWMGIKAKNGETNLNLSQWDAYNLTSNNTDLSESLAQLLLFMDKHHLENIIAQTQLLIGPGYDLKVAKGIITNFHQPKSTLLLLIASFLGDKWRHIYQHALNNNYRFLSYGDSCLFLP